MPNKLEQYLALPYRYEVSVGDYGGFVVRYPDLPGCITQVDREEDIVPMAKEILAGWLSLSLELDQDIPLPRDAVSYSGKLLVRMPKTLHHELSERAQEEGVSLNAYVCFLLANRTSRAEVIARLDDIRQRMDAIQDRLPISFANVPSS